MRDFDPTVRSINEGLSGNPLWPERIDKIIVFFSTLLELNTAKSSALEILSIHQKSGGSSDNPSFTDHTVHHSFKIIINICHSANQQNLGP